MNANKLPWWRPVSVVAVVGALLAASACGSGEGGGAAGPESGDGLPPVVRVVSTNPVTGPAAQNGIAANEGHRLAIKEINESGFLGDTTIEMEEVDTAGDSQTAASELTKAITDDSVSAVFGAVQSESAVAQAPIAQNSKMPIIFTQAGSDGVVIGEYTFRLTPTMNVYYPILSKFMKEQGWKTMGILYTAATPSLEMIGEETLPAMAEELGIEVVSSVATQGSTQDFTAPISQLLKDDPDGVAVLLIGAANPTAMTQLRQAGYEGAVLGSAAAASGVLDPAGEDGAGMVWPVGYHPSMEYEASRKFTEAFREEYGEDPMFNSADSYDAAWFFARALKRANSANREDIQKALDEIAAEPWTGALGENLTFTDRILDVPGVVVEKTADGEKLLYYASDVEE